MEHLSLLILGLLLCALGLSNIRGNISSIHAYNRRRVSPEDIPRYGKAMGTGTLVIGLSFMAAFLAALISEGLIAFIILPATGVGLGFMLHGQFKYNKGIF